MFSISLNFFIPNGIYWEHSKGALLRCTYCRNIIHAYTLLYNPGIKETTSLKMDYAIEIFYKSMQSITQILTVPDFGIITR